MATHDLLVETHSDLLIENAKISDSPNVLPLSLNIKEKLFNLNNIIIDEVTPITKASQLTFSIVTTNIKLPPSANTKDDYDVIDTYV